MEADLAPILVVTDDADLEDRLDRALRREGASATVFGSVQALLRKAPRDPDGGWDRGVVLLDLAADAVDLEAVGRLAGGLAAPTVTLGPPGDAAGRREALERGADEHLPRDEDRPDVLLRTVRRARDRARGRGGAEDEVALLESTLGSVREGILVVDLDGNVLRMNDRFRSMWGLGDEALESGENERLVEAAADRLRDAEAFRASVERIREAPAQVDRALLRFADGRVLERCSRPHRVGGEVAGRVLTFRDVTERERTEEALRESEERFRSLYENASIGLYRTSPDGRVLLANPAMLDMLGYESMEQVCRDFEEEGRYPPNYDREAWKERLHEEDEIRGLEATWTTRDGEEIRVRESTRVVRGEDGEVQYYEGTVEDVTDRWEAERELEHRNELLTALHDVSLRMLEQLNVDDVLEEIVERASDLLGTEHGWIFLRTGDRDRLELRYTTDALEDQRGLELRRGEGHAGVVWVSGDPMVVEGYDDWEHRTPGFPEDVISAVAGVPLVTGGELRGVLGVGHGEPGEGFAEEELGTLDRFGALASVALENARLVDDMQAEIRDRRETEEALRRSEQRYRTLVDAAPDIIWSLEPDGTIESVNPAVEEVAGWHPGELQGRIFPELVHPGDVDEALEAFEALVEGEDRVEMEIRGRTRDGGYRRLHVVGSSRWVDGELEGLLGIARDVTERKEAQEALAQSEERYRTLVEAAPDAIYTVSLDGTIESVNPAFEEITGWAPEEWEGRSFEDLLHPDDVEEAWRKVGRVAEGEDRVEAELRFRTRDGGTVLAHLLGSPRVVDGEVQGLIGIGRDVTERKERERRLAESERRLRRAQEVGDIGHWVWDVEDDRVEWSDELHDLWGVPPEASPFTYERVLKQVHPDDRGDLEEHVQRAMDEGEGYELHHRVIHPDGEVRWMESRAEVVVEDGDVVTLRGTSQDVTERKRSQEALAERTRRLETLVSNLPGVAYRCRNEHGWPMSYFRGEVEDLTGYTPEEIEDGDVGYGADVVHPDDRERVWEEVQAAVESGEPFEIVYRIQPRQGERRWVWERGRAIPGDGEVQTLEGFITDITDHKEAQAALRESQARLQEAQRVAQVGSWEWDILEDSITWSDQQRRLLGVDPEEPEDPGWRDFMDWVHPDDRGRVAERFLEAVETGSFPTFEYRTRGPGGDVRWLEARGEVRERDGEVVAMRGTTLDITERVLPLRRYEALVEASPDAIVQADEDGEIVGWNEGAEAIFGYAEEEAVGEPLTMIMPEEYREDHRRGLQRFLEAGEGDILGRTVELEGLRADGTRFPLEISLETYAVGDARFFSAIIRDVTERREAQEELRRSEARYRRLVEGAPDPICTLEPDGTVASMNPAWTDETGLTEEEVGDRPFEEFLHPEDRADAVAAFRRVLDGERADAEFRVRTDDGSTFWGHGVGVPLYEDGEVDKVLGVVRNITELKETEDRLRTVKNFNQTLLEHAPVGIAHVAEDGSLTYQNRALRRLRGVEDRAADDLEDTPILEFEPVREREELHARIEALLEDGRRFAEYQSAFETPEGDEVHLALSGVPVEGGGGDVAGAILLARDVTEERELEREVERQTVQLVHSEKMAALGHLVAGIAHEINNPLSVIRSNTELLLESAERTLENPALERAFQEGEGDVNAVLEEVVADEDLRFLYEEGPAIQERNLESLERIADFIDSLRTFSAPDEECGLADLNAALRDTTELFLAQYREEVDLRTDWGDLPPVSCDESQVGQVVMNLLLNASQASRDGAPVTLRTRHRDGAAWIEVEDEGVGIPEDERSEIFDPFFTTKEDDNMGLGLSISEHIVESHGGSIHVESTPGEGTVFRVELPVEEGDP